MAHLATFARIDRFPLALRACQALLPPTTAAAASDSGVTAGDCGGNNAATAAAGGDISVTAGDCRGANATAVVAAVALSNIIMQISSCLVHLKSFHEDNMKA